MLEHAVAVVLPSSVAAAIMGEVSSEPFNQSSVFTQHSMYGPSLLARLFIRMSRISSHLRQSLVQGQQSSPRIRHYHG